MIKIFLLLTIFLFNGVALSQPYPVSDHYDGKNFSNPNGVEVESFWRLIQWLLTSSRVPWPDHVANKNYPLLQLAENKNAGITFINQSTFLIQVKGLNIITDPVFSKRVSPLSFIGPKRVREPGLAFELLPKIDVVLISHNHYDHLDIETLKKIDKKFHPLFLVPLGDKGWLKKEGLFNVTEMDWWEEVKVKDVSFTFGPAQHWSGRHLWDKNECLWGSFMIDMESAKIFFAGDSGYGNHFLDIKNRLGSPDLALLPIGAYLPRWFMHPHHMDPEEAVKAHIDLGAKRSIGMHFGTFQLTDEGMDEPVRDLTLSLSKMKIVPDRFMALDHGQSFSF